MWGGIPRYVLAHSSNLALLHAAIVSTDMQKILHCAGEISAPDDVSHRILHIAVGKNDNGNV